MGLQEDFDKAAEEAKQLPDSTSNDDMLILYGLFKQASRASSTRRSAWDKLKGKSSDEAKQEYIMKVAQLKEAAT